MYPAFVITVKLDVWIDIRMHLKACLVLNSFRSNCDLLKGVLRKFRIHSRYLTATAYAIMKRKALRELKIAEKTQALAADDRARSSELLDDSRGAHAVQEPCLPWAMLLHSHDIIRAALSKTAS